MTVDEIMLGVVFASFVCWAIGFGYLLARPAMGGR